MDVLGWFCDITTPNLIGGSNGFLRPWPRIPLVDNHQSKVTHCTYCRDRIHPHMVYEHIHTTSHSHTLTSTIFMHMQTYTLINTCTHTHTSLLINSCPVLFWRIVGVLLGGNSVCVCVLCPAPFLSPADHPHLYFSPSFSLSSSVSLPLFVSPSLSLPLTLTHLRDPVHMWLSVFPLFPHLVWEVELSPRGTAV